MKLLPLLFTILLAVAIAAFADSITTTPDSIQPIITTADTIQAADTLQTPEPVQLDTCRELTEAVYAQVARELQVEVAAIKAVVEIEAGVRHKGFVSPGKPIINFDRTVFVSRLRKAGINEQQARANHPEAFCSLNQRKYGSTQLAQYARLEAAMQIDRKLAIESTFWGMFQIGGFNWRKCGASSLDDFVAKMSKSEPLQLEMFANFITSTGIVKHLRAKNWSAFARAYNGTNYAQRGYHTRLAKAYHKYSGKSGN